AHAALAAQPNTTQYPLAHIAIAVPEGATPQQLADAQRRVEEVKARLDSGEIDFAAAAVRYSDRSNALEGGDLGWRNLDEIPPSFAQIITSMQPAQVFGPIPGPSGCQLLHL